MIKFWRNFRLLLYLVYSDIMSLMVYLEFKGLVKNVVIYFHAFLLRKGEINEIAVLKQKKYNLYF